MDAADHYRKAEELAAKASEYLGQGDGQDSAAAWAAVAQVHATLALAGATTAARAAGARSGALPLHMLADVG
jgi:2'-5' RNA ligase